MTDTQQTMGEEIGAEIKKKISQEIDKELHSQPHKEKKKKTRGMRRVGYAFAIVCTLLFLWIVNNVDNWGWQFITSEWNTIIDIIRLSIYISIVVYAAFIISDTTFLYYVGKLIMDGFSIYVGIRIYQVFPFDFNYLFGGWGWLNDVFPWIIIIGIVVAGIMIVVRTVKLCIGKQIYD